MPAFLVMSLKVDVSRRQFAAVCRHHQYAICRVPWGRNVGACIVLYGVCGTADAGRNPVTGQVKTRIEGLRPPIFQRNGPLTEELLLEPARFWAGNGPGQGRSPMPSLERSAVFARPMQFGYSFAQGARGWFHTVG